MLKAYFSKCTVGIFIICVKGKKRQQERKRCRNTSTDTDSEWCEPPWTYKTTIYPADLNSWQPYPTYSTTQLRKNPLRQGINVDLVIMVIAPLIRTKREHICSTWKYGLILSFLGTLSTSICRLQKPFLKALANYTCQPGPIITCRICWVAVCYSFSSICKPSTYALRLCRHYMAYSFIHVYICEQLHKKYGAKHK